MDITFSSGQGYKLLFQFIMERFVFSELNLAIGAFILYLGLFLFELLLLVLNLLGIVIKINGGTHLFQGQVTGQLCISISLIPTFFLFQTVICMMELKIELIERFLLLLLREAVLLIAPSVLLAL